MGVGAGSRIVGTLGKACRLVPVRGLLTSPTGGGRTPCNRPLSLRLYLLPDFTVL